tara:strand:- start:416 stop:619 length:204 start_codon:yes stop_codon:yes gene_type:complete
MEEKYVIIYGNFSEGYELVGPFDDMDSAEEYAELYGDKHLWGEWITTMMTPQVDEMDREILKDKKSA